ncbi:phosphatidylinositol kinase (PIK-L4), partial [Thraustotheca clavata]
MIMSQHVRSLVWKNGLLMKKHPWKLLFEVIFPVLLFVVLGQFKQEAADIFVPEGWSDDMSTVFSPTSFTAPTFSLFEGMEDKHRAKFYLTEGTLSGVLRRLIEIAFAEGQNLGELSEDDYQICYEKFVLHGDVSTDPQSPFALPSACHEKIVPYKIALVPDTPFTRLIFSETRNDFQNTEAMTFHLKEARLAIMGPLAAASLESYQRVYPLLHQLHVLHELEQGFLVLDACKKNPTLNPETQWLTQCPWELRDRILAPALKYQEPVITSYSTMAIQILNYLFVEQPIKPSWGQVALLLALVPSFKIEVVSSFAIDHHPLDGVLTHVLALLKHWDSVVREVGLLHLTRLLCTRSRELQDLILMAEGIAHASVFNVLQALLSLSRTETNENVKALCAQSLGALGAIDLGRLPLRLSRPATNELSTKDLTCVLIEKLLVNELRAAPQNTDLIALSIQELLKFLAGLRIDPTAPTQDASQPPVYAMSASMPDWMQRRFHQTKVLQIIAPYWSTKYKAPPSGSKFKPQIIDDEDDYTTFYDTYGAVAYEKWLTSWCKSLIDLSTPPEKTVFLACRTALGISTQMARFLLPYLVQNVLKRRDAYSSVKREIDSVLQDDQSESDIVSSHHHQCAQTVLSMLDTLNDWIWTHQRRRQAASQQASKSASVNDDITDQEKEVVEEFLKDISPAMLSAAACKIKAYARGIQYYETHLRQSGVSPVPTYSKDGKGQIKSMTLNDIRELQSMYGQLDEPDALRGLSVQRALLMGSSHAMTFPDLMHTIIDHEHLARWEDALACYEQAIHRTHGNEVDLEIRSLLYAGVIRCMVQLGRLEGALQHVRGIVVESPDVIPSVYPFALECAWRLSRWNLLQELTTDAMKVKLESQHMVS